MNSTKEVAPQTLVAVSSATEDYLVALFARDLHTHQADIPDAVLGAGVGATRYVEINRLIEDRKSRIEVSVAS